MTNLTLDVNIIDFPSIPVAMLPHRCSPELLNYSVAKFIMWRKETGLSPVNQSQTFGVAWDDPATTAPEAFRFDICGSVSEPIPDNRYGVSNGELTGGRYAVARHVGELDDISHTIWGIIRHWLPASGEKNAQSPDPVSLHQSCRRDDRAATGNGYLCTVSVMGNLYRSVSQITRDKFELTMPQAYCCRAYNFSGKEYHVYAKFIMAGQPGKCGSSLRC